MHPKTSLPAVALILLLFIQPAAADCKYFKNADGFPLGIVPTPGNITLNFNNPVQQNASFSLYIEAETGTSVAFGCAVELSIANESNALKIELSNYTLETGLGYIERPFTVIMTPSNLVNFPDEIRSYIKITDVDQRFNYALLPITATFNFDRQKPKPSPSVVVVSTAPGGDSFFPSPTKKPATNSTGLGDLLNKVEESSSKYVIAIIAFFFLAALLWVGFNSLQRE